MVAGGPYGLEELVQNVGYRTALLLLVLKGSARGACLGPGSRGSRPARLCAGFTCTIEGDELAQAVGREKGVTVTVSTAALGH